MKKVSSKNGGRWKRNWLVYFGSLVSIRWTVWRPQLVLDERYERGVKWTLRAIALLSVVSSLFIFPSPLEALGFAIVVFAIQQFFEKTLFVYTTMYVQPFPDFEIVKEEWTGMGYAFPEPPGPHKPNIVGPAFNSEEYAARVFALLRSWNYDQAEDKNANICLSIVLEGSNGYTVFIFPNPDRPTASEFFEQGDALKNDSKHGKEHRKLVMMLTFCRTFPVAENSLSARFIKERQAETERPSWLQAFRYADGKVEMLFNIKPILVWNVKIKRRDELAKNEIEYTFRNQGHKPIKNQ